MIYSKHNWHAAIACLIGLCVFVQFGYGDDPASPATAADGAAPATEVKDSASAPALNGRVTLNRPAPKRRIINMSKDAQCVEMHKGESVLDEEVIVGAGRGLKNVFVYIRRGVPERNYTPPAEPAHLDQKGCMYYPRVQGVRVGQKLLVDNSDPVTHNVRSFPVKNKAFNFGQPANTDPRERVFDEPEREIEVQCDFHPWMHAYIFVMDHPFFCVTAEDGTYSIPDLPPGEYTVGIWHEKFGRKQQNIALDGSGPGTLDFAY
jgi:hypothetical protein